MVGAGQLARMTWQAAISLGVDLRILADSADDGAALVTPHAVVGSYLSFDDLRRFAASCDVVTFDHELVDPDLLRRLEDDGHVLRPSPSALLLAQDKARQREVLGNLGLPVPAWAAVEARVAVSAFAEQHGWPVVLKATRGGYDGRGVWVLGGPEDVPQTAGRRYLIEEHVAIERELSVLVARRPGGEAVVYDPVRTVQSSGICTDVVAPAAAHPAVEQEARDLALRVAEETGVVGILAVELFETPDGRLVVNELAMRPHNSGHHTIEGCVTSQFENHVRAVLDLPLGDPSLRSRAVAMANVLGRDDVDPVTRLGDALAVPGAAVHLYGKSARPGRKLGHVTVVGDEPDDVGRRARRAADLLTGG